MTFSVETVERLPDWFEGDFDTQRMNQTVQIVDRRFKRLEEAVIQIDLKNTGVAAIGGGDFASAVHTHAEAEITDLGAGNAYVSTGYISGTMKLGDISDVLAGASANQVLKFNGASWGPSSVGTFAPVLASEADQDLLVFDGAEWVNRPITTFGFLPLAGGTMSGDLLLNNNVGLKFGDGTHRLIFDGIDELTLGTDRTLLTIAGEIKITSIQENALLTVPAGKLWTFTDGVAGFDLFTLTSDAYWRNSVANKSIIIQTRDVADAAYENVLTGVSGAASTLHYGGLARLSTQASGEVRGVSNINIASDSAGTPTAIFSLYDSDQTHLLGWMGFDATNPNVFKLHSFRHGGNVQIVGQDAAGATALLAQLNPDGASGLYFANALKGATTADGMDITNTAVANTLFDVVGSGLNIDGVLGLRGDSGGVRLRWDESALEALLVQTAAAGTEEDVWLRAAVNGVVTVYSDNVAAFRSATQANGALQADKGDGFVQVPIITETGDRKFKTADEVRTSTVALADDIHLAGWNLITGKNYAIRGHLIAEGATAADLKVLWQFSNAPVNFQWSWISGPATGTTPVSDTQIAAASSLLVVLNGATRDDTYVVNGAFTANVVTGGTLDMQWAQQVSDVVSSVIKQGSWIEIVQLD